MDENQLKLVHELNLDNECSHGKGRSSLVDFTVSKWRGLIKYTLDKWGKISKKNYTDIERTLSKKRLNPTDTNTILNAIGVNQNNHQTMFKIIQELQENKYDSLISYLGIASNRNNIKKMGMHRKFADILKIKFDIDITDDKYVDGLIRETTAKPVVDPIKQAGDEEVKKFNELSPDSKEKRLKELADEKKDLEQQLITKNNVENKEPLTPPTPIVEAKVDTKAKVDTPKMSPSAPIAVNKSLTAMSKLPYITTKREAMHALTKYNYSSLSDEDKMSTLESIKMFIDTHNIKDKQLLSTYDSKIKMWNLSIPVSPTLVRIKNETAENIGEKMKTYNDRLAVIDKDLEQTIAEQKKRLEELKRQKANKTNVDKKLDEVSKHSTSPETSGPDKEPLTTDDLDANDNGKLDISELALTNKQIDAQIAELEKSIAENESKRLNNSKTIERIDEAKPAPINLDANKNQLYKDVELALSYYRNPEIIDSNALRFKESNNHAWESDVPRKKQAKLVQLAVSKYIGVLLNMKKNGLLNESQFAHEKQQIINSLNDRYFGENNEFNFRLYNSSANKGKFQIKDAQLAKNILRAKKGYVNQNAPNKDTFFAYNMQDIYELIEDFFNISLSQIAKDNIESIVKTSIADYVKSAEKQGLVVHHAIAHGYDRGSLRTHGLDKYEAITKLIEKYINSRKNVHIKMKYELHIPMRNKLIDIIKSEVNRNIEKQKSKYSVLDDINRIRNFL